MHRLSQNLRYAISSVLLLPVHIYRRVVSPMIGPRCRYYPTCSSYAVDAVRMHGPLRGSVLALWRVLRCNPLSDGGFDYPENQRLFRRHCDESHNHHHASNGRVAS